MLTTTTFDLLLTLGINISDLAKKVLDKKTSKEERQQVQELLQRYERIQKLHVQIQALFEQYYHYLARLVVRQSLDEVYPLDIIGNNVMLTTHPRSSYVSGGIDR